MIIDLFGVLLASENQDYLKKPPHFLSFATKFQTNVAIAPFQWPCHHQYLSKRSDSKHSIETIGMVLA